MYLNILQIRALIFNSITNTAIFSCALFKYPNSKGITEGLVSLSQHLYLRDSVDRIRRFRGYKINGMIFNIESIHDLILIHC